MDIRHVFATRTAALLFAIASGWAPGLTPPAAAQLPTRTAISINVDGSIGAFAVSPDSGALSAQSTVSGDADPRALVIDPSARFVYVASAASGRLQAFAIAGAGLTPLGSVALNRPVALAVEPTGRFLYVADGSASQLLRLAIRNDGSLSQPTPDLEGVRVSALAVHPSGRLLYGLGGADGRLYAFAVDDRTGRLTVVAAAAAGGTRASALAIEPRGQYLYVLHREQNQIVVFRLQAGAGTPVRVQTVGVNGPAAVAIERTGRFLYVARPDENAVVRYRIGPENGSLSEASVEVLGPHAPESLAIDPSNRFLYAVSPRASTITVLSLDGGDGTPVELLSVPGPGRPVAVALAHPRERFLFARGTASVHGLRTLRIDPGTGSLTEASTAAAFTGFEGMVVDRSGRYLYAYNADTRAIDAFRVDQPTGQLTLVQSVVTGPGFTGALTIEPTGRFLFIACTCEWLTPRIKSFRIDAATGLLAAVADSGYPSSLYAVYGATDISGRFLYTASGFLSGNAILAVDQVTGQATPLSPLPLGGDFAVAVPMGLVADPRGRFLYATFTGGGLSAFRLSSSTGALTPIGTYALDGQQATAAIDPTGRRLYVTTTSCSWPQTCSSLLHTFTIDEATGALSASTPPVPFSEGATPRSVSIDATGRFLYVGRRSFAPIVSGGFWIFGLDPATGLPRETGEIQLPDGWWTAVTSGPVK